MCSRRSDSKNIIGAKFGKLTVLELDNVRSTAQRSYWICKCECGNVKSVYLYQLTSGQTKSCGCLIGKKVIHGDTVSGKKSSFFVIWDGMIQRCTNAHNKRYKDYGGRGINVCNEWIEYQDFRTWSLANNYVEGLSIERVDVNKGYEPNNCIWIPLKDQCKNKRNTKYVVYKGVKIKFLDLLDKQGKKHLYKKILHRINDLNWEAERAVDTPIATGSYKNCLKEYRKGINE